MLSSNCVKVLSVTYDPVSDNNLDSYLPWVKETDPYNTQLEVLGVLTLVNNIFKRWNVVIFDKGDREDAFSSTFFWLSSDFIIGFTCICSVGTDKW